MIAAIVFITLFYVILIGSLIYGFDKVEEAPVREIPPKKRFSIIIPFRNESKNLPELLASIEKLNYPKNLSEVIFVNDESQDDSVLIIENAREFSTYQFKILHSTPHTGSPKKEALRLGIKNAAYEMVITTDADCVLPRYWLDCFDSLLQREEVDFVAAPVLYAQQHTFLYRFQAIDNLSLQAATIGAFGLGKPFLCNGANLCFRKRSFDELDGYKGNAHITSGDDIFLLEKFIKSSSHRAVYLKNPLAAVKTKAQPDRKTLLAQRVRWTSKSTKSKLIFSKVMGVSVLLMNILILAAFMMLIFGAISGKTFLYLIVIKFSIDFLLIFKAARYFSQEQTLISYLSSAVIYPLFVIFVSLLGFIGKFNWKNRNYTS